MISTEKKLYKKELFELLDFISLNYVELYSESTKTSERKIIYISNMEFFNAIEERLIKLTKMYNNAFKTSKRMPLLFPYVIRDVEHITVTKFKAHQSVSLRANDNKNLVVLLHHERLTKNDEFNQEIIDRLKKCAKENNLIFSQSIFGECQLLINKFDLLKRAKAKFLQIHYPTGYQYNMNVRKKGEHFAKKYKFGFVILNKKATIERAIKEMPRTHKLAFTLPKFNLPFLTTCNIYIKN